MFQAECPLVGLSFLKTPFFQAYTHRMKHLACSMAGLIIQGLTIVLCIWNAEPQWNLPHPLHLIIELSERGLLPKNKGLMKNDPFLSKYEWIEILLAIFIVGMFLLLIYL